MQQMAVQMEALDDFVTRARSQNGSHHEAHLAGLERLTKNIKNSFTSLEQGFGGTHTQLNEFQTLATQQRDDMQEAITPLSDEVRQQLVELRKNIQSATMTEYKSTGSTPPRTSYDYPKTLPRTESHTSLLERMKPAQPTQAFLAPVQEEPLESALKSPIKQRLGSPVKTRVYNDAEDEVGEPTTTTTNISSSNTGLREVDINVVAKQPNFSSSVCVSPELTKSVKSAQIINLEDEQPPLKKLQTVSESKLPQKSIRRAPLDGRENLPFNASIGGR
jgi:kinesin family member 11